jgi:hypothetical protein
MSLLFAIVGLGTSYVCRANQDIKFGLAYFSVMELFQSGQYLSIEMNWYDANTFLTVLSYIHICFQPIAFWMLNIGYTHKEETHRTFVKYIRPLQIAAGIGMLMRLNFLPFYEIGYEENRNCLAYPTLFEWSETEAFLAPSGHVAWNISLRSLTGSYILSGMHSHFFWSLVAPIVVERTVTVPVAVYWFGAITARLLSTHMNEAAPLWCLSNPHSVMLLVPICTKARDDAANRIRCCWPCARASTTPQIDESLLE